MCAESAEVRLVLFIRVLSFEGCRCVAGDADAATGAGLDAMPVSINYHLGDGDVVLSR